MITDANLRLSEAQGPITATAVSTNTIDIGVARDIGEGRELFVVFTVTTGFTGAAGNSITFEVISASNTALSADVEVIGSSKTFDPAVDVVAGTQIAVRINPEIAGKGQRYLGARYVEAGTIGGGVVTADVVLDIQDGKKFYASGFTTDFVGIPTP
jgi:hypothetical protein